MKRTGLSYIIPKCCVLLLLSVCVACLTPFSYAASSEATQVNLADGEYTVEVVLGGGSGRASITSPTVLTVRDGKAYARIEWSSPNYDYMKMGDQIYSPIQQDGNSTFEIPVAAFDTPVTVIGDTTAMSTPHEVEYTLTFALDSVTRGSTSSAVHVFAGGCGAAMLAAALVLRNRRKGSRAK